MPSDVVIRPATRSDLAAIGRMGVALMRAHCDLDRDRFMAPRPGAEAGYGRFLGTRLDAEDSVVLVAERGGEVIGYAYAALEPIDWMALRDAAGFLHDVFVDEAARGGGVAKGLVEACVEWLHAHGAPRVLLWTAARNAPARRLFDRLGFRQTMIEMTRETPGNGERQ